MGRFKIHTARLVSLLATGAWLAGALPSAADDVPVWKGTVTEISGPEDSVVVLRGTDAYALYPEDKLFVGDKVFTRTNGTARILMDNCDIVLESASFIEIDDQACTAEVTQLDAGTTFAGIPVLAGTVTAAAETGAAIGVAPLLATATGAAAAAGAAGGGTAEGAEPPTF